MQTTWLSSRRDQGSLLNAFFEEKSTHEHAESVENKRANQEHQAGVPRGFRENLSQDISYSDKTEQPEKDTHIY
jgi:hypothetical protein